MPLSTLRWKPLPAFEHFPAVSTRLTSPSSTTYSGTSSSCSFGPSFPPNKAIYLATSRPSQFLHSLRQDTGPKAVPSLFAIEKPLPTLQRLSPLPKPPNSVESPTNSRTFSRNTQIYSLIAFVPKTLGPGHAFNASSLPTITHNTRALLEPANITQAKDCARTTPPIVKST